MLIIPILVGLLFILTLTYHLLTGKIALWAIIMLGVVFLLPIAVLIVLEVYYRITKSNTSRPD